MNIYQKLIEVRKTVPYLQKESKGYQYNYCGSSQVLSAVRAKMDELGLLLVPRVLSHTLHPKGEADAKEHLTELEMEFTWVNAEKPEETIVCPWYGQGLDTGEKGVGKALTYAEKYFMLKFFNIATDKDDPDSFQEKSGGKPETNKSIEKAEKIRSSSIQTGNLTPKQIKRFYAIVRNSGAGDEVTKLVVEKVALRSCGTERSIGKLLTETPMTDCALCSSLVAGRVRWSGLRTSKTMTCTTT